MKGILSLILTSLVFVGLACSSRDPAPNRIIKKQNPIENSDPSYNGSQTSQVTNPEENDPIDNGNSNNQEENTNQDNEYIDSNGSCATTMKEKKEELQQNNLDYFVLCYEGLDSISACQNVWDDKHYKELVECKTSEKIHQDSSGKKSPIFFVYKKTASGILFSKYLNIKPSIDDETLRENIKNEINKFIQ